MEDPLEELKATFRGAPDTDAGVPGIGQVSRIVRRALTPGCTPTTLTRWIRAKATEFQTRQMSEDEFNSLVEKVAAEIVEQLRKQDGL